MLFDCLISYLYMCVLKLTSEKIVIFTNFPLFSAFQCEASGQTWLTVRTQAALPIANLAVDRPDELLLRSDAILQVFFCRLLSQLVAHDCSFIYFSCHVECFSRGFLLRFLHSLHISSHELLCVILCSFKVFVLFRILEYLLIGIFS
jgi:hypothetical protein